MKYELTTDSWCNITSEILIQTTHLEYILFGPFMLFLVILGSARSTMESGEQAFFPNKAKFRGVWFVSSMKRKEQEDLSGKSEGISASDGAGIEDQLYVVKSEDLF